MDVQPPTPDRALRGPARLARGWAGALVMTVLAAAFHSAAAGAPLPGPGLLVFSVVLAAPLCTLLAGRVLSLWRTTAAVLASQGLFHLLSSLADGSPAVAAAPGIDPAHLGHARPGADGAFLLVVSEGAAPAHVHGPGMVLGHLAAAALTVLILGHGERALVAAAERVLRATPLAHLLRALTSARRPLPRPVPAPLSRAEEPSDTFVLIGTPGRRGPPAYALAA